MASATEHRKLFGGVFLAVVIIFLVLDSYFVDFETTFGLFENVKIEKNRVDSYVKSLIMGYQGLSNETGGQEAEWPSE